MMYHVEILLPKAHNNLRHLELYEPIVHKNVFLKIEFKLKSDHFCF